MSIFFGTDGIRGKYNKELTTDLALISGNALGRSGQNLKILIGGDTRSTGNVLTLAFACGAMSAGAFVTNVGTCPTAGISFLTQKLGFDYGVVISASHNPAEYNGIKIFDKTGRKISEKEEENLEKRFFNLVSVDYASVGKYHHREDLTNLYTKYLENLFDFDLTGKTIVLDCSNGASSYIASKLFKRKGAKVFALSSKPDGLNINDNCGSLNTQNLQNAVIKKNADFGFAYDGDSDRLIAVSEKGEIVTGDQLVYAFAMYYKKLGALVPAMVVGTKHSNMGVELALEREKIKMLRADVGDKYVSKLLDENNLLVGGEQSGHIILKEFMPTGDGILSSLFLAYVCHEQNLKLSDATSVELFKQTNINVVVKDKNKITSNEKLLDVLNKKNNELCGLGRLMVRASGTEQVVRIMVESKSDKLSSKIANEIYETIKEIDN